MKANAVNLLDDAAAEHVYQLNHVYIPSPTSGRTVLYEDRLFVVFDSCESLQPRWRACESQHVSRSSIVAQERFAAKTEGVRYGAVQREGIKLAMQC